MLCLVSIATLRLSLAFTTNPTSLKRDGMKIDPVMIVCVFLLLVFLSSFFCRLLHFLFCLSVCLLVDFVVVGLFD